MKKERIIYSGILISILIILLLFSGSSTVTITDTTVTTTNIAPDGDYLFLQGDTNVSGNMTIGLYEADSAYTQTPALSISKNFTEESLKGWLYNLYISSSIDDDYELTLLSPHLIGAMIKTTIPSSNKNELSASIRGTAIQARNYGLTDMSTLEGLSLDVRNYGTSSDTDYLIGANLQKATYNHVNNSFGVLSSNYAHENATIDNNYFLREETSITANSPHEGTKSITNNYGLWFGFSNDTYLPYYWETGYVDNHYGLYIDNTNTGTQINNTYGVYIKNVSSEVNSYALYAENGDAYLNGNVTANYYYGNGSQLTGITADAITYTNTYTISPSGEANYTSIQTALDANPTESTLFLVYPGTYTDTIHFTANKQCVAAVGHPPVTIVTQADANVVNVSDFTSCTVKYLQLRLTAPTTAINLIDVGDGHLGVVNCKLYLATSNNIAGVNQPHICEVYGTGEYKQKLGEMEYLHTGDTTNGIKCAYYMSSSGSQRILRPCLSQIINSGTANITTLSYMDNGGSFEIDNLVGGTISDPDASIVAGLTYLDSGVSAEYNIAYCEVNVTGGLSNEVYVLYHKGSGNVRSSFGDYKCVDGSTNSPFYVHSGSTLTSHFDNIVADAPYTGSGTVLLVSSEEDGNLTVTRNVTTDDLHIPNMYLSGPYHSINEWFRLMQSPGRITGGAITQGAGTTVNVSSGVGWIRVADDDTSQLKTFEWDAEAGIDIPNDGDIRFIGIDYNGGSPRIVNSSVEDWNLDTNFSLGIVSNEDGQLHILPVSWWVSDSLANILERYQADFGRVSRDNLVGGLVVSESGDGNKHVQMSQGVLWSLLNENPIDSVDTSTGDSFVQWYRNASGGWTSSVQTTWNNSYYDDGTGTPHALGNNKYMVLWWYIEIDGDLSCVLGRGEYSSSAIAETEGTPATLPNPISYGGLFIARMIVQQGQDIAINTQTAFSTTFTAAQAADHGNLAGLLDDDHPQYLLLAGRGQGQNVTGYINATTGFKTTAGTGWSGWIDDGVNTNCTYSGGILIAVSATSGVAGYKQT